MGFFEDLSASSQSQTSGIRVAPETQFEQYANPMLQRQFQGFEGVVGAGPGAQQMTAATQGTQDYANMLQRFSSPEGMFAAQNQGVEQYTRLGEQIFGGQMRQQQQESSRLAGRMGRPVNDPILQAKLAQQRSDSVGSFAAQQAMQLPGQMAQFAGQRSDALQGLASQAMANRQALLGMGSQLREQDRSYRINTGERYNTQQQAGSFLGSLGAVAGIAGSVMGGIGALKNASTYASQVGQGVAKGAAQGAAQGLAQGAASSRGAGITPQSVQMQQVSPIQQFTGGGGLGFGGGAPFLSANPAMQRLASGGGFTPDFNYNYGANQQPMSPLNQSMMTGRGY